MVSSEVGGVAIFLHFFHSSERAATDHCAIWGPQWEGSSVLCHCDNEGVVAVVRGGYCKDPLLAYMLRCLFFLEAKFDITLSATHVPGTENRTADSISRNNLSLFF